MSQPPYGAQPGQPQPYPGQPAPQGYPPQPGGGQAPPPYLQGGAHAATPGGGYGQQLPPAPASEKRTIGFLMGLVTVILLIGFAALVLIISKIN